MSKIQEQVVKRFAELAAQAQQIPLRDREQPWAEPEPFYAWAASALNVIQGVFGKESPHYLRLESELSSVKNNYVSERQFKACRGIFLGAKSDIDGGYLFDVQTTFSGEIFGDFVATAKAALDEGQHTVACVLACAALEDALKRLAVANGLSIEDKTMEDVVNALKTKGLVSGPQKALLGAMPRIRNYAMHADWAKLSPQDAGSVIGYVEQFLLSYFS
ncbi:MAG: DUF4145 domain-containing protein [Candidatus Binatia bacterium]